MKTVNQYLKNKAQYDKEMEEQSKKKPRIRTVREIAQEQGIELGELTSEKSSKGFFKDSKAFDDGYQFGDVTKTIFSTGGDLLTDIGEGFIGATEGVADWGQYRTADILNFFGQKKAAEAVKKNAQFNSTAAIFGKNERKEDNFAKDWTKGIEENSISGETLDTVMQGVGQVGAMVGLSYLGGGGAEVGANATKLQKAGALARTAFASYTSAYGNARSEAYKNGADDSTANKAGMINGFSEAIAEQFFNGLPGFKSAGWFSKVNGKVGGKIEKVLGSKIGRTFLKLTDTMGEGAEEMISNSLNSLGTNIAHYIGTKTGKEYNYGMENLSGHVLKDMYDSFTSSDSIESFFSAAITSALIGGGNTFLSNVQKNTILKEYAKENNISVKQAEQQLNTTIESQMPNLPFEEKVEEQERIQKQELRNMKKGDFVAQEINTETPNLPMDKKNQRFDFDSSKITDEFEKSVYESASKSLNNTEQTHKFVDKVAQIAKDKKTSYGFINSEELKNSGYNIEGKEIGGLVTTNENGQKSILINIDSPKALNAIVGHETTHLLEGTKEYQELQQSIFEYAKQKGDFDGRQQTLSELYKDVENADINSEITADLVGDYLFTDEKFINSLSTNKPTIFQRIKDLIDDLVVKFKGTKEERLLREVQKKFKTAYKQDGNLKSDKYMMIGKNGAKNLSKNSNDNYYKNLNDNLKKAQKEYNDNNDLEQENIKSKGKYQWFKTKYGDWGTFISDKESKLKQRLEPNHTYKLSEILDHDLLYKAYPELKNLKVETADIASTGGLAKTKFVPINTITDIVYLRNSDLNEKNFKYTLLHEINHYIEFREKYDENSRGADSKTIGREAYKNNLGELISNTTKMNANLTQEQLNDIILPEIAKKNPKYENIKDNLDKINELERKEAPKNDSKYANETKEKQIQNSQKNSNKTIRQTNNNDRLKGIYDYEQNKFINNKDFYEELDDSSFFDAINSLKEKQNEIIQKTNPMLDDYHVGIRSTNDIRTWEEVLKLDDDIEGQFAWGDYTREEAEEALKNNKITIYSSNPIKNGTFISTSRIQAEEYAGGYGSKVYSKEVPLNEVAWINGDEGQYAKVVQNSYSLPTTDTKQYGKYNVYGEDVKYQKPSKVNLPINGESGILTDEDYKDKTTELLNKFTNTAAQKINNQTQEIAKRNLELKKKDTEELKSLINNYNNMTKEQIFKSDAKTKINEFVRNHSSQEFEEEFFDTELSDLQKEIKRTKFIIDEKYKGEFPDGITAFKKLNPGLNIVFGTNGNIDSRYQELAETHRGRLSEDATTGDIPYLLADILNQETKLKNTISYELNNDEIEQITNKIYFGLTNNSISNQNLEKYVSKIHEKIENKYARQMAIQKYRELAKEQIGDITEITDKKKGILYQVNTMKRNLRDIMSPEQAKKMYDTYFKPITVNNAKSEVDKQSYVDRIQKFNLSNEESVYVQMLGEKKYNPKTAVTQEQLTKYLEENYNKIDTSKVNSAVEEFRNIYDELIVRVNNTLKANGYAPIDYRKGYFPHFIEDKPTSVLGKFAEKLGWKINKGALPTDIAGITEEFKPGKAWTSFSQRRTGNATDYNASKGLDNYLNGAMDVIYHTEDIQKLRALENEIRYQYSDKGVQEKIDEIFEDQDLTAEEKYEQISLLTDHMKNNGLGNFATELRNYTNNLANKKSFHDRSMEQSLGRDTYSIMNNISSRVSANMVGANISSALTNFIPITQAWSQISTKNLMKGLAESIKATIKDDGFANNSVYLINRTKQADKLYKTTIDKINDKLAVPFEAIDSFTSNTIVRAKYLDNIEKGMSEQMAMENADEFAKDVMAGRSKGDNPTIFNQKNPIAKLFTAFQLEVNNQYGYMFKDIKADLSGEAKDKLAAAFVKMFLGAWLYNYFSEKITGRKSAFSPIDMAIEDIQTATNENMDLGDKVSSIMTNTAQELPFVGGVMGGGRLPIQGAIPYENPLSMITSTISDVSDLFDEEKKDTAIKNLTKEWQKPLYYLGMPFGGGQIKKTVEGLSMYDENLPIAGSYTNSGKLRFEADDSTLGKLQAAVFGQYASKNAREYFENGYSPLSEKQVNEALDANLPIDEYREINKGIKEAKAYAKENEESQSEAEYNYIYNLPISMEQKNSLLNSKLGTSDEITDKNGYVKYKDNKDNIYWVDEDSGTIYNNKYRESNINKDSLTRYSNKKDLTNYGDYGSLEEFNYANSNPTKYSAIKQITDYDSFKTYKDDIASIKQDYNDGTTRGSKVAKQQVFQYINSLNLNKYQKLMLEKMAGGYSIKNYKSQMREYIESLNLTKEEKQAIDKELFG